MSKIKITEFKTFFQTFNSFSISTTFKKTGTACDESRDPKGTHTRSPVTGAFASLEMN